MTTLALLVHPGRPDARALADDLVAWCATRGVTVVVPAGDDRPGRPGAVGEDDGGALDLVVALGGDGTMLRAARRAVAADAPVLGVNLGRLGYLAEVEPGRWAEALADALDGRSTTVERMLVAPRLAVDGAPPLPPALNEVVVERREMGRTVRLGVAIDGRHFTSYVADGVIIATPTGSTAYSLSARGPIVAPEHRALLLTAVSPHSLFDRSLVLEPTSTVTVEVLGDRPASLAVDGEPVADLDPGQAVAVTAAARSVRFVTAPGRDFHQVLKTKFGLSDR